VYSNGGTHCFSCSKTKRSPDSVGAAVESSDKPDVSKLIWGDYRPIPDRKISVATCEKYGYQINDTYKDDCDTHIAPYHNENGDLCAQHLRFVGTKKAMPFKGTNPKTMQMFGQRHFTNNNKRLYICEGEIDTMSLYQALGSSWPVVGIAGAERTDKTIKANLEYIESFDEVVLFFDNDDAGKKAVSVALDLISYGKAKYVTDFPVDCNDANDILVKHGDALLRTQALFKLKTYTPDGIKEISEIRFSPDDFEISLYPWPSFNKKLFARRSGELTVFTSGTGMGKSTILRAIYSGLAKQGEKAAMIMLEESTAESKADLMSAITGKPIRKIMAQIAVNKACAAKGLDPLFPEVEAITDKELRSCEKQVDDSGLILVDHSKGYDVESILSQIRFLAISKGVKHILLDHITLLIASDSEISDDVKALDICMKKLRLICEETGVAIDLISHIRKRSNGAKSVNGGAQIAVEELRGSGSLAQIANNIVSFERDQHAEDPNVTVCRSLKTRMGGYTGVICTLKYDPDTGQLTEQDYNDDNSGFTDQSSTDY
jgi:twinkle protein